MTEIASAVWRVAGASSEVAKRISDGKLSKFACAGWGLGGVGFSVIYVPFQSLFLRFLTDHLGIAAAIAGSMIALGRLSDALSDLAIGPISDRTKSHWGRRRPYLFLGAMLTSISFVALFFPPKYGSVGELTIYMTLALLAFSISFTLWYVPYLAMTTEMTNDHESRSLLVSFRVSGSTIGQLIGGAGSAWLLVLLGNTRLAYGQMAEIFGLVGLCCMLGCIFVSRNVKLTEVTPRAAYSPLERLRLAFENKPFMVLILMKTIAYFGGTTSLVSCAFFSRYVLHVSDFWLGSFLFVRSAAGLLSVPFWMQFSKLCERRSVTITALIVIAAVDISWMFATSDFPIPLALALHGVTGICTAGLSLMAYGMLADVMEYDYLKVGLRREGAMAGLVTLIEKTSGASGVALTGIVLGSMGYVQSTMGVDAQQASGAITGVYLCFSIIPAASAIISSAIIWRYSLDRKTLDTSRCAGPPARSCQ